MTRDTKKGVELGFEAENNRGRGRIQDLDIQSEYASVLIETLRESAKRGANEQERLGVVAVGSRCKYQEVQID